MEASDAISETPDLSNLKLGRRRFWLIFLVADFLGLVLSGLSLGLSLPSWIVIPVAACFAFTAAAMAAVAYARKDLPTSKGTKAPRSYRWVKPLLLAVVFAGAFFLGTLFQGEDNGPVVLSSPYHVVGTTTNGSNFVNECREPSPCAGKDPVGRLQEGDPVFIECQIKGEKAESIAEDVSYIWDRVDSGAFVSDLYVSTPNAGHFSKGLSRCSDWK